MEAIRGLLRPPELAEALALVAAVEEGSLARAGARIGVSQPADDQADPRPRGHGSPRRPSGTSPRAPPRSGLDRHARSPLPTCAGSMRSCSSSTGEDGPTTGSCRSSAGRCGPPLSSPRPRPEHMSPTSPPETGALSAAILARAPARLGSSPVRRRFAAADARSVPLMAGRRRRRRDRIPVAPHRPRCRGIRAEGAVHLLRPDGCLVAVVHGSPTEHAGRVYRATWRSLNGLLSGV